MLQRRGADPAGYGQAVLSYEGVDFAVLRGKTIVLDPGHGGAFSGAVGKQGLAEKEVNLSVALLLRDLLAGYGANVVMTRSADVDLLPAEEKGAVSRDLAARADSANRHDEAAIFLSLHHNALGAPNPRYNATETYYKLGDQGPSLDLARFIHRRLVAGIGLERQALRPGNYYVLRNSRHPAVLGEASYLSHPGAEAALSGEAARKLEAYAYLLGIVDYLSGGVPLVEELAVPGGDPLLDPFPRVLARVRDESGREGIDPQRIELELDGAPLPFSHDPASGLLSARIDRPLANGPHRVAVRVRNLRGNAGREALLDFRVAVPPAYLRVSPSLERLPLDGMTPVTVTAVAGDRWGRPVADSTEVLFEFSDPNLETFTARCFEGRAMVRITPAVNRPLEIRASCGDVVTALTVPVAQGARGGLLVLQAAGPDDQAPLAGVSVRLPGLGTFRTGREGMLTLEGIAPGGYEAVLERPGYLPLSRRIEVGAERTALVNLVLEPVLGGVLHGKKIVLDPRGGMDDPGQLGPAGSREADLNYAVAELLADYLRRAGAEAVLTRSAESSPGEWERALRAEELGGGLLVALSHAGAPVKGFPPGTVVNHYPGSGDGKRLAGLVAEGLAGFAGRPWQGAAPGYQRILQQVSCPAVWVRAAAVGDPAAETMLADPAALRREAYAIFTALARFYGWEPSGEGSFLTGRLSDGRGNATGAALVLLDGWLPLQSDPSGRFLFRAVTPGAHRLEVHHRGRSYGPYQAQSGRLLELLLTD